MRTLSDFIAHLRSLPNPSILELGTRRSIPGRPTHHKEWAPHAQWTLTDLIPGEDVDVLADAHNLERPFGRASFDAVISCSTFEHLLRPWVVAQSIARVLKPQGVVFVSTHQTFPLHAYPMDYWRFSKEALHLLLHDARLEVLSTWYDLPAHIISIPQAWWPTRYLKECVKRFFMPTYLCVSAIARKSSI